MSKSIRPLLPSLLTLAALAIPATAGASARKSNSKTGLPRNLQLGDVDGDGFQDLVQFSRNKVFAYKTNFKRDGILHGYLPAEIDRLVLGDFTTSGREHGRDQVCAVTKTKQFMCYSSSNDNRDLWWWFTQPNFVQASEQIIVGDFDGNGADDILLYRPSTGGMRFFTRYVDKTQFQPMKDVALGNLSTFDRKNKIVLAGDFGQAVGRDDLIFWDKGSGKLSRYDSVTSNGKTTFWWAFHTSSGFAQSHEFVRSANVQGGTRDGIAVFDPTHSEFRFYKAEYNNGSLAAAGNAAGNLAGKRDFTPIFGHLSGWHSEPGTKRDDILLYNNKTNALMKFDARWNSKSKQGRTYWSAYTASAPNNHTGWPAMRKDKIFVGKCRFSNVTPETRTHKQLADRFGKSGRGKAGFYDYAWDQSYGMVDIQLTMPKEWKKMLHSVSQWKAVDERWHRIGKCLQRHGVDTSEYKAVAAFINSPAEVGAAGNRAVFYKDADHSNMIAHEMFHTYGLPHSFNVAQEAYKDGYDIMGGIPNYSYNGTFARTGVGLHAYWRSKLGFLPSHRRLVLNRGSSTKTKKVTLAAVDRPESNGVLLAEIRNSNGNKVLVELREKRGWDRNIPKTAVLVRRAYSHPNPEDSREVTYLQQANGKGPDYTTGETFQLATLKVKVLSMNASAGTAEVEITY